MDFKKPLFVILCGLWNLLVSSQNTAAAKVEQAFIRYDYNLLEPFLAEELKPKVASLFKDLNKNSSSYSWQILSHKMLPPLALTDIDFGLQEHYATLALTAKNQDQDFELNYKYYNTNKGIIIYYMGSYLNPFGDIHIDSHNFIQQFKSHSKMAFLKAQENETTALVSHLEALEKLISNVEKTSGFKHEEFNINASKYYVLVANNFMENRNGYEAITYLEKAIELNPNDQSIYLDMAICNIQGDDWDGAYNDFLAFSEMLPDSQNLKKLIIEDLNKARYAKLISNSKYKKAINVLNQDGFTSLEFEEE